MHFYSTFITWKFQNSKSKSLSYHFITLNHVTKSYKPMSIHSTLEIGLQCILEAKTGQGGTEHWRLSAHSDAWALGNIFPLRGISSWRSSPHSDAWVPDIHLPLPGIVLARAPATDDSFCEFHQNFSFFPFNLIPWPHSNFQNITHIMAQQLHTYTIKLSQIKYIFLHPISRDLIQQPNITFLIQFTHTPWYHKQHA
jgi:hypothetical protein